MEQIESVVAPPRVRIFWRQPTHAWETWIFSEELVGHTHTLRMGGEEDTCRTGLNWRQLIGHQLRSQVARIPCATSGATNKRMKLKQPMATESAAPANSARKHIFWLAAVPGMVRAAAASIERCLVGTCTGGVSEAASGCEICLGCCGGCGDASAARQIFMSAHSSQKELCMDCFCRAGQLVGLRSALLSTAMLRPHTEVALYLCILTRRDRDRARIVVVFRSMETTGPAESHRWNFPDATLEKVKVHRIWSSALLYASHHLRIFALQTDSDTLVSFSPAPAVSTLAHFFFFSGIVVSRCRRARLATNAFFTAFMSFLPHHVSALVPFLEHQRAPRSKPPPVLHQCQRPHQSPDRLGEFRWQLPSHRHPCLAPPRPVFYLPGSTSLRPGRLSQDISLPPPFPSSRLLTSCNPWSCVPPFLHRLSSPSFHLFPSQRLHPARI